MELNVNAETFAPRTRFDPCSVLDASPIFVSGVHLCIRSNPDVFTGSLSADMIARLTPPAELLAKLSMAFSMGDPSSSSSSLVDDPADPEWEKQSRDLVDNLIPDDNVEQDTK